MRLGKPECGVESGLELLGGRVLPGGELRLAAMTGQARHRATRGIDVALDLGQGDRPIRRPAVEMTDRIARILPALVQEPELRASLVLDEAVAVEVARVVDPGEGGQGVRPQPVEQRVVAGPGVSPRRISQSGVESMLPK